MRSEGSKEATNHESTSVSLGMSEAPELLAPDDLPPSKGWAVAALSRVYKNAQPVGVFSSLTIFRDRTSVLAYDYIRDPPG
jgi:hypothetical protein